MTVLTTLFLPMLLLKKVPSFYAMSIAISINSVSRVYVSLLYMGQRQRPDLAIHKFTRLIQEGKPIPFYGDGSTSRDYSYIDDIVDGINCSLNHLGGYNIYNLGESKVITLKQMVEVIEGTLHLKAVLNKLPIQPGDVSRTFADISKAKEELGYNPKYEFEAGIKNFVEWYNSMKSTLYKQ